MVSQHTMFGRYWSSAKDIKYLICHVISQRQVIEVSINLMGGKFLWYVKTLPGLVAVGAIGNTVVEMFLIGHMFKQDHMINGTAGYKDRSSSS